MNYETLLLAIANKVPMIWNDPLPIEDADYRIAEVLNVPTEEDIAEGGWEDWILLIKYGEGSEAEVLPHEISINVDEIIDQGEAIEEYPVDESQSVSNAGEATIYTGWGDIKCEVIIWNDRAEEHQEGQITFCFLD